MINVSRKPENQKLLTFSCAVCCEWAKFLLNTLMNIPAAEIAISSLNKSWNIPTS